MFGSTAWICARTADTRERGGTVALMMKLTSSVGRWAKGR
jgi:hypothetical protein